MRCGENLAENIQIALHIFTTQWRRRVIEALEARAPDSIATVQENRGGEMEGKRRGRELMKGPGAGPPI